MKTRLLSLFSLGLVLLHPAMASAAGIEDVLARGSLRVGVCEFIPWTFTNRGGQLEGFEIDVSSRIAHDMGVKPDIKVYTLESVFEALDKGEIDFISAGLAITPSRALRVEFSLPYFESGATLVTNKKLTSNIGKVDDLNQEGYVIVTVEKTFSAGLAEQFFDVAKINTVTDGIAAEKELLEGRAHGYMTSLPDAQILARRHADVAVLPLSEPIVRSVAGFGVRRGNQSVLNYLNAWIESRRADNWLSQAYSYWFSGYDWNLHVKQK